MVNLKHLILFIVLYSVPFMLSAQVVEKLKSASTEEAKDIICNTSGSIKVIEGNLAYTSYKNALKQANLAERNFKMGGLDVAKNNLKNSVKYIGYVLKKEPNADLSEICSKFSAVYGTVKKGSEQKNSFTDLAYQIRFFIQDFETYVVGMYEGEATKRQKGMIEAMPKFHRGYTMTQLKDAEVNGVLDYNGIELKKALSNVNQVLRDNNIIKRLYGLLDELDKSSAVDLADRTQRVITVLNGFKAFGGDNSQIKEVLTFANSQLNKAEAEMDAMFTGAFHKENVNKIIFTKQPFQPGNESSLEINPVFKTGDAVFATIYMKGKISDIFDNYGESNIRVEDQTGQSLQQWFEKWERENYTCNSVKVLPSFSKDNTYYQFVLIPNLNVNMSAELKNKNFTPIHMARGATKQSARKKTFDVSVSTFGSNFGTTDMKGSFQFDFSVGSSKEYYQKVENKLIEKLIVDVQIPRPAKRDMSLEAQLLQNMKSQGYPEQYTKAIITQGNWEYYRPLGGKEYREIEAAFPYKLPNGKCGYQIYSFKSFKNGNGGWTKPQKFGGTDSANRVTCDKL